MMFNKIHRIFHVMVRFMEIQVKRRNELRHYINFCKIKIRLIKVATKNIERARSLFISYFSSKLFNTFFHSSSYFTNVIKIDIINVHSVKKYKNGTLLIIPIQITVEKVIMDYCPLQFDDQTFFLAVRMHRGSLPNFNFFNVTPQIFQ